MKAILERRRIIEATATLLAEDPTLSNVEILRRLAMRLGPASVAEIPVNRVRRIIREPALEFLRSGVVPADRRPPRGGKAAVPAPKARDATGSNAPVPPSKRKGRSTSESGAPPASKSTTPPAPETPPARRAQALQKQVDAALMEAFSLGVESRSRADTVRAFGRVQALREKLGRRLARGE